jgi:hypothetical protein
MMASIFFTESLPALQVDPRVAARTWQSLLLPPLRCDLVNATF